MLDVTAWILIALLLMQALVHRRLLGALWSRTEDPRSMAALRIATGVLVLAWIWDIAPLATTLYSSEGLFTGAQAQVFWGPPGRISLLFAHDSPALVRAYVLALTIATTSLTLGLLTGLSRWLTFALFIGLVTRNGLVLGGEQIFTFTLFGLALSRCGRAYSIDAWWRRRRHGPSSRQAIPAWPRNLLILQMLPVFCANGLAKYGRMWRDGDTLHYVVNHPHFRPTELYGLSAMFGTTVMRAMTWVTHAFEILMPLVVVGLVIRVARAQPDLMPTGRRRFIGRVLGVAIGASVIALAVLRLQGLDRDSMPFSLSIAGGIAIAVGPVLVALARRLPPKVLAWALGRRLWVSLWVLFTAQLAFVLDIGRFTALTLCLAVVLFDGEEIGHAVAWLRRRPAEVIEWIHPARSTWRHRLAVLLSVAHVVAVMAVVLPAARPIAPWRRTLERPLRSWVRLTTLAQHWRMFAPSGPTRFSDIELRVRDPSGATRSLGPGLLPVDQASTTRGLDKREKLRRRLAGRAGEPYRAGYVRWACRHHALGQHGPVTVELHRVTRRIPSPEELSVLGVEESLARVEAETTHTLLFEELCRVPEP